MYKDILTFYRKPLFKLLLLASALSIASFVINTTLNFEIRKPVLAVEAKADNQNGTESFPVRLKIPSIRVDAVIESVGVTTAGIMDVPKGTANVGWFNLGPRPGETGSAVIDGHLNDINGKDTVFSNLYKLKANDKIYIEDSGGISTTFVVKGSRLYDPGVANDVFDSGSGTHLNLITCDGNWNSDKKSFSKRLVVFTDILKGGEY